MSTYPPDGYGITSGVWGTDVDVDTAVSLSGAASLKFLATTPAANPEIHSDKFPVEPDQPLLCSVWMQASSIAAGNIPYVFIYWLDVAGGYISATAVNSAILDATGAWRLKSAIGTAPANTRYALIAIAKVKTAFTVNIGAVLVSRFPRSFWAYRATSTFSVSGTLPGTKVPFDTEVYDHGNVFDTANNRFVAPETGIYSLSHRVEAAYSQSDQTNYYTFWFKNGSSWGNGDTWVASGTKWGLCLSTLSSVALTAGDYIEVYVCKTGASTPDGNFGQFNTYFMGARIG